MFYETYGTQFQVKKTMFRRNKCMNEHWHFEIKKKQQQSHAAEAKGFN